MSFLQTTLVNSNVSAAINSSIMSIGRGWFPNRTPLMSRLPMVPDGSPSFVLASRKFRPRTGALGAAVADGTTTSITLTDAKPIMVGDVLELLSGERVEVSAVNTTTNVVTVTRAIQGTTGAAQSNSTVYRLIGNSRTGAEDQQKAITALPQTVTQYMQTFQHPYEIGGAVQSNTRLAIDAGAATPLDQYRMDAMQNAMDDGEYTLVYGIADSGSATGRPKSAGIKSLCVTNKVTSPSDAGAYKATSFQRDLLTKSRQGGGQPDVVFVSTNWMDAFSTWGQPLQRLDAGETVFGIPLNTYAAPFLGDVTIVEACLLPNFTAFALTSPEVYIRVKRALRDEPLAKTGDLTRGQMIMELALHLENESHHAWLEGVTAFSA